MNSFLSIKSLRELLSTKKITPNEIAAFYRTRLNEHNKTLNCALEIYNEESAAFDQRKPLSGIPGMTKDNICYQGRIASCGSKILQNYVAPYDATVITRIKNAGGSIIARANMDEFAMGGSGEFSAYGAAKNPYDLTRSPGGSSSGAAAAVAAGLIPWALGSETGGSVRQPAAFCNLVGLYPTYGLFPRYGLIAFASSSDQVGPLTRTVYDNALIASTLSGHDTHDATSISRPPQDYTKLLKGDLPENLTIGVIEEGLTSEGVDPQIRAAFERAIEQLRTLGAKIKHVTLPALQYGISVYFIMSRAEAASNLSRYDGSLYGMRAPHVENLLDMYLKTRNSGFGAEVKRRILMGNFVLSAGHKDAFYTKAMHVRNLIREEYETAFKEVDLLISPTTSTLPFVLGKESADPLAMYLSDYFTVPSNMAGLPGLSIPCGFSTEGLPIGFQFIGPRLSEHLMYQVAYAFEQHTDYHTKTPAGF